MAGDDLSIGEDPGSNALGDRYQHSVVDAIEASEQELGQQACGCGVLHPHGKPGLFFNESSQIKV